MMKRDAIVLEHEHERIYDEQFEFEGFAPYEGEYAEINPSDFMAGDPHDDNTDDEPPNAESADAIHYHSVAQPASALLKNVENIEMAMVAVRKMKARPDQAPLTPLALDISGETDSPVPVSVSGNECACCGLHTTKLWQGARTGLDEPHAVCTLCYLTGHLDSPTAAHGQLAYLPGLALENAIHLQRRALLAILGGTEEQKAEGERIWSWMDRHAREVEVNWGTARAGEFAQALKRLPPVKRSQLQQRLAGCVLMLPADMFSDFSLLLPAGRTVESALTSYSWDTYTRSDLYVEPCTLD